MRVVDDIDIAFDECSPHHYKVGHQNKIIGTLRFPKSNSLAGGSVGLMID